MRAPLDRLDVLCAAALGSSAAVDAARRIAAAEAPPPAPLRFVDMPLVEFEFRDQAAYLNATDVLAFVSITILAVRFAAWLLGLVLRRRHPE